MNLDWISLPDVNEEILQSDKGVSLVAVLDTDKQRKDGSYTIKVRIIHERIYKYYSTKIAVTQEEYEKLSKGSRLNKDLTEKRIVVHQYLKRAYAVICEMNGFSFVEFKERFTQKRSDMKSVYAYYDQYIDVLNSEERIGTRDNYTYSMKKLKEFHGKNSISFETITPTFLRQYEKWILDKGHSKTTVGIYCRPLKKIFNDAIADGIIGNDKNPFGDVKRGKYQAPEGNNTKKALSLDDLKKIIMYVPEPGSPEHYYRDIWVFSYLGNGINMKDLCLLKYKDIDGNHIRFSREKTKNTNRSARPISIALIEMNKRIIERWGRFPRELDKFIFPVLDGKPNEEEVKRKVQQFTKQVNKYMKKIGVKLNIDATITTYYARHSYVTASLRAGVDIHTITENVGHSSLKVIGKYIDSLNEEESVKNANKLLKFD
ncbi:site-specific integrase [Labilibaculum sp. DW002]|uniref:Site-specific integrase n=1 Tax=Paralabilibaculum antarcticum TaxID=2912572 RepID=A0ABT5VSW1_9BACT|nr:site-specific integrase [Labilibaculum sp. DW002]MDE5418493.1 site-specific integrase [Labilibaculum sp. DW002]